ncbi:hypothetical protein [Cellulosimicrobium cellulans]
MLPLDAHAPEDPAVPIAAEVVGAEAAGDEVVGTEAVGAESVGAEAPGAAATGPVRTTAALLAPGLDVATPADGRGWVVRVGDDGRVAVRFETARTGPGYQRWVDPEAEELALVEPLGPDGEPVRASPADDDA